MVKDYGHSQASKVLHALKQGMRITQRQASRQNIWRLASRIAQLRTEGWNIKTKLVPNKGAGMHAEYYLGRPHMKSIKGLSVGMLVKVIANEDMERWYSKGAIGKIIELDDDAYVEFYEGRYKGAPKKEKWYVRLTDIRPLKAGK